MKAADLINLFHPHCAGTEPMQTENARRCALKYVEGVMSELKPNLPSNS